jgi:hypothetical protein
MPKANRRKESLYSVVNIGELSSPLSNREDNMKNIIYALSLCLCLWIAVSFVDIVKDNNTMEPVHNDWNFFVMITKEDN